MKVRKGVEISGVVVASANVRELASKVYDECCADQGRDHDVSVVFTVFDKTGTQYDDESPQLFREGGVLDSRPIMSVVMRYTNYSVDKGIEVDLTHDGWGGYGVNKARVWGPEEIWVVGVAQWIDECVAKWRKQEVWAYRYASLLTLGFAVLFGETLNYIVDFMMTYVVPIEPISPLPAWLASARPWLFVMSHAVLIMWGIWPAAVVVRRIQALFPRVELAMGPEHLRIEQSRRMRLGKLVSAALFPVALALVVEAVIRLFW